MKKVHTLLVILLLCMHGFSQIPLHTFFPMGVIGISYGDTMLNTSFILKAAGIRKITSVQTSNSDVRTGFSPIITQLNSNGKIDKVVSCLRRAVKSNGICLNDTILYDDSGRMQQLISTDASGLPYIQCKADYTNERKVKYTWIYSSHQEPVADTDISYHYYNEQGRLVRYEYQYGNKRVNNKILAASFYYNIDGLLDSIRHDDPKIGTYVFERRQNGKKKAIILETPTHIYKWMYNSSGQCVASEWGSQRRYTAPRSNDPQYFNDSAATYEYNADGTLLKVVVKRDGKKFATLSYSYEK